MFRKCIQHNTGRSCEAFQEIFDSLSCVSDSNNTIEEKLQKKGERERVGVEKSNYSGTNWAGIGYNSSHTRYVSAPSEA